MDITKVSDISEFLGEKYDGENFTINGATSLDKIKGNTLAFSNNNNIDNINCKALILVPVDFNYISNSIYSVIKVKNPRLEFAKVVNRFFVKPNKQGIHSSTIVGDNCKIDPSVSIGSNCVIGDNVKISQNTRINNNVVLYDNTILGDNCYLKSGSIIGEDGFGFDFEEDGTPVRIPHIGNVTIGNDVEVGSNTVIVRGTLNNTIIKNNVKIDDQVFIAHNCCIGENTVVIAFSEISGSVTIGENCWIGPNSSIIQKVTIGNKVTIGIGSIITKDIEDNKKIMALEGLDLRSLLKVKKRIEYGK
jgi:UDP-3-O-[3-hydroxymyristoyl] glucosamine N-acyltransferase LpxD